MPAVFRNETTLTAVHSDWLPKLKAAAETAPLRRARLCLHADDSAPVHEMIIAFRQDSLVPPHRHMDKSESIQVIEGTVDIVILDDSGTPIRRERLEEPAKGGVFMWWGNEPAWHTVIPVSETAVVHEVTKGPFTPSPEDTPDWAPRTEAELRAFIDSLRA